MPRLADLFESPAVDNEVLEMYITKIKKYLMDYEEHSTWEEYVDSCELGECQYTAHAITNAFPEVTGIFGEIETDEGRDAETDGNMTHHWVEINGTSYDFAKGTLGDYINWWDKYDVELGPDDWRYHPIHSRNEPSKLFSFKGRQN